MITILDRKRFGRRVQHDLETGCRLWVGAKTVAGYGVFSWMGKRWLAHRVSWIWTFGEIPEKTLVRHKCDNPSCVNVWHLELGTNKDNAQDRERRGRGVRGSGREAILTEKQAEILDLYRSGVSVKVIVDKHKVSRQYVTHLRNQYGVAPRRPGPISKVK